MADVGPRFLEMETTRCLELAPNFFDLDLHGDRVAHVLHLFRGIFFGRTSTGQGACLTTRSAVLPTSFGGA